MIRKESKLKTIICFTTVIIFDEFLASVVWIQSIAIHGVIFKSMKNYQVSLKGRKDHVFISCPF